MTYADYERTVYDYLLLRQRREAGLRFSTRQKATAGAAGDIFIGTDRSGHFSTTFWTIPLSYPGAAADLISLVFAQVTDGYTYRWEVTMDRTAATDEQHRAALSLAQRFRTVEHPLWLRASSSPEDQRTERTVISSKEGTYATLDHLLTDVGEELGVMLPEVDTLIRRVKEEYPGLVAHRITENEFTRMQERLQRRQSSYRKPEAGQSADLLTEPTSPAYSAAQNPYSRRATAPLNQIFYGPPGTGKTYASITEAVRIANPAFPVEERSRQELRREYQRLTEEGRIVFTTFHQSLTYEDFVEGLKPVLIDAIDGSGPQLSYRVVPGIFRAVVEEVAKANSAAADPRTRAGLRIDKQLIRRATAYHLSLAAGSAQAERNYRDWMEQDAISVATDDGAVAALREGDLVLVSSDPRTLRAIGTVTGAGGAIDAATGRQQWPVQWLYRDLMFSVPRLYGGREFSERAFERLDEGPLRQGLLREYDHRPASNNYVLIVDEINRGDVSRIFGELITLLEADKRAGRREALAVTLPYSRQSFTVPDNLYLIGTMNTVDRGVVQLDTALRRRFVFRKLDARPELLTDRSVEGVDLRRLLTTINHRLRRLTDRPQPLGHTYLLEVDTLAKLRDALAFQLVPLLEELLYGNQSQLLLVIGTGFFTAPPDIPFAPGTAAAADELPLADPPSRELLDIAAMDDARFLQALAQLW